MSLIREKPHFKDAAGTITAFVVVLSFIAIGFVQGAGKAIFGVDVTMPESWSAAMLSLASAALGFLIGKNDVPNNNSNAVLAAGVAAGVASQAPPFATALAQTQSPAYNPCGPGQAPCSPATAPSAPYAGDDYDPRTGGAAKTEQRKKDEPLG